MRPRILPQPNTPVYILTAADGFVTSCHATQRDLMLLAPHLAQPMRVDHWVYSGNPNMHGGWVRTETFTYPDLPHRGAR